MPLPYLDQFWGGSNFPIGIFARIVGFAILGWQSLPGGPAPGPRPGPTAFTLSQPGGGGGEISRLAFLQDIKISVFGACPGAQPPGLGRAPPRLPYLDWGGANFPV